MARRTPWCVMGIPNDSKNSYGETPFKIAFGTEVVIPVEVSLSSLKREPLDKSHRLDLDCLDEDRDDTL